jgi:hypothetical protein
MPSPHPPLSRSEDARLHDFFQSLPRSITPSAADSEESEPTMTPSASSPSISPAGSASRHGDRPPAGEFCFSMPEIRAALDSVSSPASSSSNTRAPPAPAAAAAASPPPSPASAHLAVPVATASNPTARRRRSSRLSQPRHEVQDEAPPEDRYHAREFQQALAEAQDSMAQLRDVLATHSLHHEPDTVMQRLFRDAQTLCSFQRPSTRTVGFVGDSGAGRGPSALGTWMEVGMLTLTIFIGKSSLLNSLLDIKGLARASNSGAACTCVVTEYHHHNSPEFKLVIEWFTPEEILEQLEELLSDYRHFQSNQEEMSDEESAHFQERAQLALDMFKAMFRDMAWEGTHAPFLVDQPEEDVLNNLVDRARRQLPPERTSSESFANAASCSERLVELTSEPNAPPSRGSAKWPFIKKIR